MTILLFLIISCIVDIDLDSYIEQGGFIMRYQQLTAKDWNSTARQILDAAYELFSEKGYNKVTTRDIARKADVNLGLITYYFSSKANIGAIVMMNLNNKLYKQAFEVDLPEIGSAEKLYIYTALLWRYIDENLFHFILEYFAACSSSIRISSTFMELSWEVIKEYNLPVTPAENEVYASALKGAELTLVQKRNSQELNITYEDISNLVLSNYYYNIGLSDKTILSVIKTSEKILNTL